MKNSFFIMSILLLTGIIFVACAQKSNKDITMENSGLISYQTDHDTIYLLSEGDRVGKSAILIGATPEMIKETIPGDTFPTGTNAFLVLTPHKKILIDAGYGTKLVDNIIAVGLDVTQIDIILLTHLHGDHIGGLLNGDHVVFPNAALYIAQQEYDYWMSDEAMNAISEAKRGGFKKAREVIAAYKAHLHLFNPSALGESDPLLEDIMAYSAYGHTPGHTIYQIGLQNDRLMIWGDLTHAMAIQMYYPQVAVSYDVNPDMAVISREKVLRYIVDQKMMVAGMHIATPGIGSLENATKGYKFSPLP